MNTNHTLPVMSRKKEISVNGLKITVSEMAWHATFELLRKINTKAGSFVKDGKFNFNLEKLADLLTTTEELSTFLIVNSTGQTEEWLKQLSFGDGLEVLDTALEINLSPEIMAKTKKVAGRFTETLGTKAAKVLTPIPEQPPT
jgi:hypothetical protein